MNGKLFWEFLKVKCAKNKILKLNVSGNSMYPMIREGDSVTIHIQSHYDVGDILVFLYKENKLLIHRLIKKSNQVHFCKGDNSFRLEDVLIDKIIGKVILINDCEIKNCSKDFVGLSYAVNREFVKHHYDVESTKKTEIYKDFINKRMELYGDG